ncbi:P-loop NTPase fold protein [Actinophytocola sediminis]
MSRPTADTTAAAESWLRSERDLQSLLDEALEFDEIDEVLSAEDIPRAEARAVILEDPNVLAALRTTREWWKALLERSDQEPGLGLRSRRMRQALPVARMAVAAVAIVVYVLLSIAVADVTPLWVKVFTAFGFLGTAGFAVGLVAEDLWRAAGTDTRNRSAWRSYALDEVIVPRLLQFLDERRGPDYGTTLTLERVHDLYRDTDDAPVIITAAGRRLWRVLERSTSDAVAIAGYRGMGKTTAIRAAGAGMFSDPSAPPPMRIIASAPSRYDARDFLLHLHAMLAKQVIATTDSLLWLPRLAWRWTGRATLALAVAAAGYLTGLFWLAFLLDGRPFEEFLTRLWTFLHPGFVGELMNVFDGGAPTNLPLTTPAIAVVILALSSVLVLVAGLLRWPVGVVVRRLLAAANPEVAGLRAEALRQFDRIRFLQTYTSGWSGKVGLPFAGSDVGWTRGSQRAEQQLTHPEVVEAFRKFAGQAASVLVSAGAIERIVIAVDELDKIAEPDRANEFVNDIKGIFGVDGCLFLVAVSEDAMSAFERRGIPVRDEFDSAFSEMVRLEPFTVAESRRWMSRRLLGLQVPFSCLCHCLSGGLPRDLRRSTIHLIDTLRETDARDLESVAALMVRRELAGKAHAFAAAVRRLDDSPEVTAHLTDLVGIAHAHTPADLVDLAARLAPDESSALPRTRWQSACFVLFCATVLEVFTNDLTESGLARGIELLGSARAQLAVDPHVAWRMVGDVRDRYAAIPVPGRSAPP